MKRAWTLTTLAIGVVCGAALTQSPATIEIGTASLHLGMTEQQVEAAVGPPFKIQKQASDSLASWFITMPTTDAAFTAVASMSFRYGRLYLVRRYWGPSDQQAGVPFAKALYGAASQLVTEGRRRCELDVGSRPQPGGEARTIFLICPGKRLEIGIFESEQFGNAVNIDEILVR